MSKGKQHQTWTWHDTSNLASKNLCTSVRAAPTARRAPPSRSLCMLGRAHLSWWFTVVQGVTPRSSTSITPWVPGEPTSLWKPCWLHALGNDHRCHCCKKPKSNMKSGGTQGDAWGHWSRVFSRGDSSSVLQLKKRRDMYISAFIFWCSKVCERFRQKTLKYTASLLSFSHLWSKKCSCQWPHIYRIYMCIYIYMYIYVYIYVKIFIYLFMFIYIVTCLYFICLYVSIFLSIYNIFVIYSCVYPLTLNSSFNCFFGCTKYIIFTCQLNKWLKSSSLFSADPKNPLKWPGLPPIWLHCFGMWFLRRKKDSELVGGKAQSTHFF